MKIEDDEIFVVEEVAALFKNENLQQHDVRDYIEKRKLLYKEELTQIRLAKEPHGCEKCTIGQDAFIKMVNNRVASFRLFLQIDIYLEELTEIMVNHFNFYLKTALYFSSSSVGICHFRHFVDDALSLNIIRVNRIVRKKNLDLAHEIVQEAMQIDPLGTQVDLIEINRIIRLSEWERNAHDLPLVEYEKDYIQAYQDLEEYATKIGPIILQQQQNKVKPEVQKPKFESYLTVEGKVIVPKMTMHFKNIKGIKIAYLLFALHELKFLTAHPYELPQQSIVESLAKILGNTGTRQAFQAGLKIADEKHRKVYINAYKKLLTD